MAAPPADVDPEHFITGTGIYDNLRVAVARDTPDEFRIDPAPFPWPMIIILNSVFIAFFGGVHLLIRNSADDTHWLEVNLFLFGVGLFTCVGFTTVVSWRFLMEQRRGVWLIYDKTTRLVHLPREGEQFTLEEIVHLQFITTKRLDLGGFANYDPDQYSELNLITCRDGERRRWHLLSSMFNIGSIFEYILRPLVTHTPIPVVRIRDSWRGGWDVTIKPYR